MPSTRMLDVRIRSLPCFEQEGMVWIWPGDAPPSPSLPSLLPPPGFQIHAEVKHYAFIFIPCKKFKISASNLMFNWTDCDGASNWARASFGQSLRPCTCSFYSHLHFRQRMECPEVCVFYLNMFLVLDFKFIQSDKNENFQFGEVPHTSIRTSRVLGSLSDRHGIPPAMHCTLYNWNLKAGKTGGAEH